ncbi:MAG: hypothetical protein AB7S38_06525 [Vulcanimicrobiota bacterium]
MKPFLLVLLLLLPALAEVPTGTPPADAPAAFARSSQVFVGTVVAVNKDKYGYPSLATVQVDQLYKGKLKGKVKVDGHGGPTYPARLFKEGQQLLFYLNDDLRADSYLNRVLPLTEASADLEYLKARLR